MTAKIWCMKQKLTGIDVLNTEWAVFSNYIPRDRDQCYILHQFWLNPVSSQVLMEDNRVNPTGDFPKSLMNIFLNSTLKRDDKKMELFCQSAKKCRTYEKTDLCHFKLWPTDRLTYRQSSNLFFEIDSYLKSHIWRSLIHSLPSKALLEASSLSSIW